RRRARNRWSFGRSRTGAAPKLTLPALRRAKAAFPAHAETELGAQPLLANRPDLFDSAPRLIAKIEVESAIMLTDPNMDGVRRCVELRFCLNHVERRLESLGIGRTSRRLVKTECQPALKAF